MREDDMTRCLLNRRRFFGAAALAPFGSAQAAAQKDTTPAFRTTTNLVVLEVSVFDDMGQPVAGLSKDNFQVKESGQPRPLSHFSTGVEQVSVGLVLDFSRSMRANQPMVASAVAQFTKRLEEADELFLVLFNESILFRCQPTLLNEMTPAGVSKVVSNAKPDGKTALYDAVLAAADIVQTGNHSRRVLVILSDGKDTASGASLSDAMAAIHSSNLLIYSIGMFAPGSWDSDPDVLRRMTETTGGLAVFDPEPSRLGRFFERVIADLRARYVIGYLADEPSHGRAETRKLKVEILNPPRRGLHVRTRQYYRIEPAAAA
jgi:VWFA-related protein